MIDPAALDNLIKNGESALLECKIAPPRYAELAERICGMANSLGGYIVLGVANNSWEVVGLKDIPAALDNIVSACRHCKPVVHLEADQPQHLEFKDEKGRIKSVVAAYIPPNSGTLYQANGIFWVRRGTQTVPLEADEIERFFHRRGSLTWETRPVRLASLEDLDLELVENYARQRKGRRLADFKTNEKKFEAGQFLQQLGCAAPASEGSELERGTLYPTNAGLLLFGYSPQDFLIQAEVVCVLYGDQLGTRRYLDRQIFHGTLPNQIDQAEDWLQKNIRIGAYTESFRRVDDPEYPLEVLREAVVNAVIHRDYRLAGEVVRIFMYQDRLEVHSPGLLLPGIQLEDLRAGKVASHPRNPVLAEVLRGFPGDYLERLGSGISFMIDQMHSSGKPAPQFTERNEFIVTFYKQTAGQDKPVGGPIEEPQFSISKGGLDLATRRYTLALEYIEQHGSITNREYRSITGVSERTAARDLEALVEQKTLRASGSRRSRKYLK